MHILKYLDQIKPPDEIPELREFTKHKIQLEPEEISLAKTLVEKMINKALHFTEYSHSYSKELEPRGRAESRQTDSYETRAQAKRYSYGSTRST